MNEWLHELVEAYIHPVVSSECSLYEDQMIIIRLKRVNLLLGSK